MKKQQAAKRKLENELKRTEDEIAKREAKIEALNDELSKPEVASNSYELNKIHEEQMQEEAALGRREAAVPTLDSSSRRSLSFLHRSCRSSAV